MPMGNSKLQLGKDKTAPHHEHAFICAWRTWNPRVPAVTSVGPRQSRRYEGVMMLLTGTIILKGLSSPISACSSGDIFQTCGQHLINKFCYCEKWTITVILRCKFSHNFYFFSLTVLFVFIDRDEWVLLTNASIIRVKCVKIRSRD